MSKILRNFSEVTTSSQNEKNRADLPEMEDFTEEYTYIFEILAS